MTNTFDVITSGMANQKQKIWRPFLNHEEAQFQINLFIQSFKLAPKSHALSQYLS